MIPFGFFLAPALLWVILFFIARHRGECSYSTLFYVSIGVFIVELLSSIYLPPYTLAITAVVCVLAIQKFCYVGWLRAVLATILYLGGSIAWSLLFNHVTH